MLTRDSDVVHVFCVGCLLSTGLWDSNSGDDESLVFVFTCTSFSVSLQG